MDAELGAHWGHPAPAEAAVALRVGMRSGHDEASHCSGMQVSSVGGEPDWAFRPFDLALSAQVSHRHQPAPANALDFASTVDAFERECGSSGLEHPFNKRLAADGHTFGEVPHAHLDEHGPGDGTLLTIDDRFGHFGAEAAPDDLAVVVEDDLTFFVKPAALDRLDLVPGGRFRVVSTFGLHQAGQTGPGGFAPRHRSTITAPAIVLGILDHYPAAAGSPGKASPELDSLPR